VVFIPALRVAGLLRNEVDGDGTDELFLVEW